MSEHTRDHTELAQQSVGLGPQYIASLIPDLRQAAELLRALDYMGTVDVTNSLKAHIDRLENTLTADGFRELVAPHEENAAGSKVIYPAPRPQDGRF